MTSSSVQSNSVSLRDKSGKGLLEMYTANLTVDFTFLPVHTTHLGSNARLECDASALDVM